MYSESQLDKENKAWFENDCKKNTLLSLSVSDGNIRGVFDSELIFSYPISVLVGENGSGKTTYLSLAACAFHNDTSFCPFNRIGNNKKTRVYYTYGDFFTFAPIESGIKGIRIKAKYLSTSGVKEDTRKKKPSGKWNDFASRPKRVVSYLGINRIVPPSESSPHRHYYKSFSSDKLLNAQQLNKIREYMSRIFGRNYSEVEIMSHNTYRLFIAKRQKTNYTGFNMGAGENAVLELLVEIMSAGKGALLVIDEIELGLHAKAQCELMLVLKELCRDNHNQILCSTHSKTILESLPEYARFYIKRRDNTTEIIPNISADFAFGQLSGKGSGELDVFVEDVVGKCFLETLLTKEIRNRVNIYTIGSADAILHQMAAHYREKKHKFIAFQDGDKNIEVNNSIKKIKDYLEHRLEDTEIDFEKLMRDRLCFLPGNTWPEKVLIEFASQKDDLTFFEKCWSMPSDDVHSAFENALSAKKHNEFYVVSQAARISEDSVRTDIMRLYRDDNYEIQKTIVEQFSKILRE